MRIKEAIGIPLLCLFGKDVVLTLFDRLVMPAIDGGHTIWYIAFVALSLIVCMAFILMAKNKSAYINSAVGQVAAYAVGAIHAVFAINIIVVCICDFSIFSFIGNNALLIISIVSSAVVVAYLFSSKAWLPIKILGTLLRVFLLVSSALFDNAYAVINPCFGLAVILNVICLILTIVWMSSKNISSENRQSINMI